MVNSSERANFLQAVQTIKPWAATGVLARHLLDHDFGIGKYMECSGAKLDSELQRFQKSSILGNIIVVMSDRFVDFDRPLCGTVDHHSNPGGSWIPKRPAIDVGN